MNIDYDIIMKNNIPILIKDKAWRNLFQNVKDKDIKNTQKELKELLKEQKRVNAEIKKFKKKKKKTMAEILNMSHRVNNKDDQSYVDKLDEYQNELIDINDKLEELYFQCDTLPTKTRKANYNLLNATVKFAYKELKSDGKVLKFANEEIDKLRERLKQLIEKKNDYEEKINETYSFLHGILGAKEMEKLDNSMLK